MAKLFGKYKIEKADGSPVDPNAMYFVLRIDADPHAHVAMRAYSRSVRASDPVFADELDEWIESRPTSDACPVCDGKGWVGKNIWNSDECSECAGSGKRFNGG